MPQELVGVPAWICNRVVGMDLDGSVQHMGRVVFSSGGKIAFTVHQCPVPGRKCYFILGLVRSYGLSIGVLADVLPVVEDGTCFAMCYGCSTLIGYLLGGSALIGRA